MDYDSYTIPLFPNGWNGPESGIITWGNIIEKREYDWGIGAPGVLLKRTDYTYLHMDTVVNPNSNHAQYLAANIADRPTSLIVHDGAGNIIMQTKYYYDESPLVSTAANPAIGHDYTNYGRSNTIRGNLTRKSEWDNATNSWYDTTYTYDDLGNRLTMTDPGDAIGHRHITTYDYTDNFAAGSGAGSCFAPNLTTHATYAFATSVTSPSPFNFQTDSSIYQCTGLTQSTRDQNDLDNGRSGTSYVYDLMNRLISKTDPDGGVITFSFGGSAANGYQDPLPLTTIKVQAIDSTKSRTSVTVTDDLGRTVQTQAFNPEGIVYVDTTYDLLSRVQSVSNPHLTTASPTDGVTQYGYDLFGRTTVVQHPDSASTLTTYNGTAVMTTDEGNGTQRIQRVRDYDGLQRLVSVCEVSNSTLQGSNGNSPSPCSQGIAKAGYLTSYQYSFNSSGYGYQTVTQGGLSQRQFTYNSLGRLLSSLNPETGAISYAYDPDGLVTSRIRPKANTPSSSSLTTITSYGYDALHRLTSESYDDGFTPANYYNYDESSLWGRTITNPKGRKTSEIVGNNSLGGGNVIAAETYSYDSMGRVSANDQCTPGICNTTASHNSFDYSYDYLGNELSATDGLGHSYTLTTDAAGRLSTASSSLTSGTLLSNAAYGPLGMIGAQLGTAINETIGYQNRGWTQSIVDSPITPQTSAFAVGTITITGAEQSHQTTTPGTQSTASVTITGSGYQKKVYDSDCNCFDFVVDTGSLNLTINGFTAYGVTNSSSDTSAIVATRLATSLNSSSSPVTATVSGSTVTFTSKATGAAMNYTLSSSSTVNDTTDFSNLTFSFSSIPVSMTGGQDAGTTTTYDTGTASITANGHTTSVPLLPNSTPASIASNLVSTINADPAAYVSAASPSPGTVVLTSKIAGGAGYYSYSFSSTSSSGFSNPSFSGAGTASTLVQRAYAATVGHAPNGDVILSTDTVNGIWSYNYDEFNRLTSASRGDGLNLSWSYDRFGNRWTQSASGTSSSGVLQPSYTFNSGNNRMDTINGSQQYDAAGNMTTSPDGLSSYFYDAEGRICSVGGTSCSTGTTLYVYDANGLRVAKYAGTSLSNQYLYNLSKKMITELDGSGNWVRGEIYTNNIYVGTYDNAGGSLVLSFAMGDWLGTIRARTNSIGTITETVTSLPFGDGMSINGTEVSHNHFTGKLHDDETGLDYFGARYFSSGQGRFLTPDWSADPQTVPYGHFETPRTLNLYTYVGNNPVTDTDPDGHDADFNVDIPDGADSVKESDSITVKGGDGSALSDAGEAKPSTANPAQQSTNTGSNNAEVHQSKQGKSSKLSKIKNVFGKVKDIYEKTANMIQHHGFVTNAQYRSTLSRVTASEDGSSIDFPKDAKVQMKRDATPAESGKALRECTQPGGPTPQPGNATAEAPHDTHDAPDGPSPAVNNAAAVAGAISDAKDCVDDRNNSHWWPQ